MTRKEDIEKLIHSSYEVIRKNDHQIQVANPKDKIRFRQENEDAWDDMKVYLTEYTFICERLNISASENILQIAAARFDDLATRLLKISQNNQSQAVQSNQIVSDAIIPDEVPEFEIQCDFIQPIIPKNTDILVQFTLSFNSKDTEYPFEDDIVKHICLVLDVSGSMNEYDKYPYLLQAIPYIVNSLSDKDWLSIILFSTHSELIWSKDIGSSKGNEDTIIQLIEQSSILFEETYLAPAIQIAINKIKHFRQLQPSAITRLYVLTDGQIHDENNCYKLNPELRRSEVEINSYGFGDDFAEETMRKIMEGCLGGRVKWVGKTDTIWESFLHIGESARSIIATDAELDIKFSQNTTSGDSFKFAPGTVWYAQTEDNDNTFHNRIGLLEKQRKYIYAFEARAYPSNNSVEQIAVATLQYSFQGQKTVITEDILIKRSNNEEVFKLTNDKIKNIFLSLEGLRNNDPQTQKASLQARLQILQDEGGDPLQIQLIKKAINQLHRSGSLRGFSKDDRRRLNADSRTTIAGINASDTDEDGDI